MSDSDIIVIGGGIAGLSAAAALSRHARVTVLEAEDQIGYHSSGRSATMVHYALGDRLVRALTLASRPFFDSPPEGFSDAPLGHRMPVLVHAREDEREALEALEAEIARFASLERLDGPGGPPLGLVEDVTYREGTAVLGPGDRLLAVTDGVTEAVDPSDAMFGEARLEAFLTGVGPQDADVPARLTAAVRAFEAGRPAFDDIAAMLVTMGRA